MKSGIARFLDSLIGYVPGMITVAVYAVMAMVLADFKLSILLLIGALLLGLPLSAMDVNLLPLRPLIIMYTLASVSTFFFIAYRSTLLKFGAEDLIVVSFFVLAILMMVLVASTRPDNSNTYILKLIIDWYGVVLLFVFLFSLYYFVCRALVDAHGKPQNHLQTCCYFSCVTFTGLGYGDIVPRPEFRMVAAMQTIIGYICMGGVAATIYSLIQSKLQAIHRAKRLEESKND
ncbi:MAG: ion channel [Victivallaceae bacterium]|nr:ion channel [Victivallaceae bacterium]